MKDYIIIRAWTSEDGWYIDSDERLRFEKSYRKYGIRAKVSYLYAKTFYNTVVVEIRNREKDTEQ